MSLFFRDQARALTAADLIAERTSGRTSTKVKVDDRTSLAHSAVWACRRLRNDLISTMPLDVYKRMGGVDIEMGKPPVFITPGGDEVDWYEWLYSSGDDLDSVGNTVGVITAKDAAGRPACIELVSPSDVSAKGKGSKVTEWKIGGEKFDPSMIWHEKQYTRSGLAFGLSPIAHAAMSIGSYLSAQEFAADWFGGGGIPSARLKNTARSISPEDAAAVKARFRATTGNGDLFVHGSDWEYDTIQAKASESSFIEQMQFGVVDVCRFLGVPADMIDAESSSGSITYANVTQRNLQLLIMHLNPAMRRREATFSRRLLPAPRFVKFNRGALLEMDLKSRYEGHAIAIDKRFLSPSEVRELENRQPFTPEQVAEFGALFGPRNPSPVTAPPAT